MGLGETAFANTLPSSLRSSMKTGAEDCERMLDPFPIRTTRKVKMHAPAPSHVTPLFALHAVPAGAFGVPGNRLCVHDPAPHTTALVGRSLSLTIVVKPPFPSQTSVKQSPGVSLARGVFAAAGAVPH